MITYHDTSSCQWLESPYACDDDDFADTDTDTTPTPKETSTPQITQTTTTETSTTSTSTSTITTKLTETTSKPRSTTSKPMNEIENSVLCDNSMELNGWECSNDNKPGSLCFRFCNDNTFENKRCVCSDNSNTQSNDSICTWTVKGKPCNDQNKLAGLEDRLGSLTSIFKYVDIVNSKSGNIHINFDLKHDKARQYL